MKITFSILLFLMGVFSPLFSQIVSVEPTAQASNIIYTTVKSYRIAASFSPASPAATGYLVLRKTGAAITDVPTDGIAYQRGDVIGASQVVSAGTATTFMLNYVFASTNYYFAIFAYNGADTTINYLTENPLLDNAISLSTMQTPNYYGSISTASTTFVDDLHALINPHKKQTYGNFGDKFIVPFIARDTINNQRVITCVYSGENVIYTAPWDWTANGFSREHTYPKSWMPTVNHSNFEFLPEYSDYHQLLPVNQNKVNAVRSNYPLGEVVNVTSTYFGAKIGTNSIGQKVYEPRDSKKGDVARALMYQAVCYTGENNMNWGFPSSISASIVYGQNQEVLKKWSDQDPPDNYEMARNDFLDSLQNNRNPFVDHPEYVCYIDFNTMTYFASPGVPCNIVSMAETEKSSKRFSILPNPNDGNFTLNIVAKKNEKIKIQVVSILDSVLYSETVQVMTGSNLLPIHLRGIASGIYLVEIVTGTTRQTQKMIIKK